MAKRKTTTRAGRPAARGKTGRKKTGGAARRSASRKASDRRSNAGKRAPARRARPKGSAARRKTAGRERNTAPENVTAEVERRWDIEEEGVPTPPSTLDYEAPRSAARSGRALMDRRRREYTQTSPAITGGDVDADWEEAYAVGDEAATGDNPTPDQDTVEAIGRAVGVDYEDNEELKSTPKVDRRDKKRWELDPASSEDYKERNRKKG